VIIPSNEHPAWGRKSDWSWSRGRLRLESFQSMVAAYACLSSIMQLRNAVRGNAVLGFAVLAVPSWLPSYKHGFGHSQNTDS
jgi:hypothetical protein